MDLRPNLRGIYNVVRDVGTFGPMVSPLGFAPLPEGPIDVRRCRLLPGIQRFRTCFDRWLAVTPRGRRAPDRGPIHPRRHPATACVRRPACRPDQARVRVAQLPVPASGQGRGTIRPSSRRVGLRRRWRQQRDRSERALAEAEAGRPCRFDRDRPGSRIPFRPAWVGGGSGR